MWINANTNQKKNIAVVSAGTLQTKIKPFIKFLCVLEVTANKKNDSEHKIWWSETELIFQFSHDKDRTTKNSLYKVLWKNNVLKNKIFEINLGHFDRKNAQADHFVSWISLYANILNVNSLNCLYAEFAMRSDAHNESSAKDCAINWNPD